MEQARFGNREQWNDSYLGGNICFYPQEEIVRFINKYVRKRFGFNQFHNIMQRSEKEWKDFKSLDLGCGIGRHIRFLDEFGLNPFGIDLSDVAVSIGKEWFIELGCRDLTERLKVGSVIALPYEDETFEICISAGTLDSMSREIAIKGIEEALRVLKKQGLMYLDLVMDTQKGDIDEIVQDDLEKDTIQSYFTVDTIKSFIGDMVKIIEFKMITWCDENDNEINRRAHIIIQK